MALFKLFLFDYVTITWQQILFDVEITTDYESSDCIICQPCAILKNCATDEEIIIRFSDSTEIPEIGDIIKISI